MIKDLSHYCFDGGPFALMQSIMFIAYAGIFIWGGIREGSPDHFFKRRERYERRQWIKQLRSWVDDGDDGELQAAIPSLLATHRRLRAPALVGAGVGVLISFGLFASVSGALTGSLLLLTSLGSSPAYASGVLFGAMGYALGLAYGAHQIRVELDSGARYGDVRPRLLDSYRSSRVPMLLTGTFLFYVVATVVEAPYISPHLHIDVAGGTQYLVPRSPALLALPLICMALTIGAAEVLAARIVSLPRLVSGLDPALAMQVDDLLRARAITTIAAAEVVIVAMLAFTQTIMTAWDLGYAHSALVGVLTYPTIYLPGLVGMVGVVRLVGGEMAADLTDWLFVPRRPRWRIGSSS